jgi:hypothetical protein
MTEQQKKTISVLGMWIAALVGSTYGLVFTIIGRLANWGPGSGMEGPLWKVILGGIVSIAVAVYVGELIVRKLTAKILRKELSALPTATWMAIVIFIGCIAAFVVGWEVGFLMSKLTGTVTELGWGEILWKVPTMSFMWGAPFSLLISIIFGLFVLFLLKVKKD